jgi:hypothetical protein
MDTKFLLKKETLTELLVLIQEYERLISNRSKKNIGHAGSKVYLIDSTTFMLNFVLTALKIQQCYQTFRQFVSLSSVVLF